MKFEKITDNKIRIICTLEDMILNKVSEKTFLSNNSISEKLLQTIIANAEKEIGFKADDCKLIVEAVTYDNGLIFTITKLSSCDNCNNSSDLFFKFDSFDDFYCFCTYIKNMNNIELTQYIKDLSLFYYNGSYYLSTFSDLPTYLSSILAEFSTIVPYSSRF